ncbi:hypothetical protein [Thioclava sp. GXIMD4215]|uniref:hypothetical protein n=1 Tax=Thioclava sp. GXIMD4215 TaxID=3131928 RepID=UPI0032436A19
MSFYAFSKPSYYKFCEEQYNIAKDCSTIRIGTLWGFRTTEDKFLQDQGEGKFEFNISFPDLTPVSPEWLSEVGSDTWEHGTLDGLSISSSGPAIKELSLTGSYSNCWIYCVSSRPTAAGNISQKYPSKWEIPADNMVNFGLYLRQLLWEHLSIADLPNYLIQENSLSALQRGLSLSLTMEQVDYGNRTVEARSEADLPIEKLRHLKTRIPFTKPNNFIEESEFRFVFALMFENERVSINDNAKILNLKPIKNLIRDAPSTF